MLSEYVHNIFNVIILQFNVYRILPQNKFKKFSII